MSRSVELEAMLRNAGPTTRREVLRRAAGVGISGPALIALLRADGVEDAAAAPSGAARSLARYQEDQPIEGGTLILTGHQEIASLSPDDAGPTVHWVIVTQIHNALVEMDENIIFQPILAEALPEVSADGLSFTFKLRQGVKFHNGEEFTSADVKYTYEWYMNPDNAAINASNFAKVDGVDAPDPYTVVVRMKEPYAPFIALVATTFIVPAQYHAQVGETEYKAKPIGTGAFKLKEWQAAAFTEVEAFPDHFRGAPHLAAVREEIVPEPSVRAIGLETGEAHSSVWPLAPEDNLRLAEDPNFVTFVTSSTAVNHFPINNTLPQLSDKRVRQAFSMAVDREAINQAIFNGTRQAAKSAISPVVDGHRADACKYCDYKPEDAKALLAQTDFDTSKPVDLWFNAGAGHDEWVQAVGNNLRDNLGIEYKLQGGLQFAEYLPKADAKGFTGPFRLGWGMDYPSPQNYLEPLYSTAALPPNGSNTAFYSNPAFDKLVKEGNSAEDNEGAIAKYQEAEDVLLEDMPILPMFFTNKQFVWSDRVENVKVNAFENVVLEDVTVKQ